MKAIKKFSKTKVCFWNELTGESEVNIATTDEELVLIQKRFHQLINKDNWEHWNYEKKKVLECICGEEFVCDVHDKNTCRCSRKYDVQGKLISFKE